MTKIVETVEEPQFKVVDKTILDKLKAKNGNHKGKYTSLYDSLMQGEVVSVQNVERKKLQAFYQSARKRGYIMKLRSGMLDDIPTVVFWWENSNKVEV